MEKSTCTLPGCDKPLAVIGLGLCMMHYKRLRHRGSTDRLNRKKGDVLAFVQKVMLLDTDECIVSPCAVAGQYSYVCIDGSPKGAHRYVCELEHGPPPKPGLFACHSCGNKPCLNRRHLRWGTAKENSADMVVHGTALRGERHPNAKLTDELARRIKYAPEEDCAALTRDVDIQYQVVWQIKSGRAWKHV